MQASNFDFLSEEYPLLHNLAQAAEYNLYQDPSTSLYKLRQYGEYMTSQIYDVYGLEVPQENSFTNRVYDLRNQGLIAPNIVDAFTLLRKSGNNAVHKFVASTEDAKSVLFTAFKLAKWFYQSYSVKNSDIDDVKFSLPENLDARHALHTLEQELTSVKAEYEALRANQPQITEQQQAALTSRATKLASKLELSEAETRELIDEQLRKAGWECDTVHFNYKTCKTLPQKGKNMAIAEWPCNGKWADYALFVEEELYGIVEAKKYAQDISANLDQSRLYAKEASVIDEVKLLGDWKGYKLPFLFAANGRGYIEQLKTKSGVWFLDVRDEYNQSRALSNFYSPEGLVELYARNIAAANQDLMDDDYDYLQSESGLALRDYQINAIKAVELKIIKQSLDKTALLVMATGTGKTRTIGGLVYRLIKANRFKKILFLTDRVLLAEQAEDAISDNKIERQQSFASIYKIDGLKTKLKDKDRSEVRLHFATVQSMVKRVFYNENPLPVDEFDCIIVDEAHRGYILDREFVEEDLEFRDQEDYIGQYKKLLFYFDAWKIGLTATPALHTKQIFGEPLFSYSYREAVVDGFLVDHEPPYTIRTILNETGVNWQRGETVKIYNPETNSIEELSNLEDDINLDVDHFNKDVITPAFNRTVVSALVQELDPDGDEKTLIFAARDSHADEIVALLYEEFEKIGIAVHQEAIKKITGSIKDPKGETKKFKNEKYPNIVVTVDLLTTGIDVPEICNLVFLRAVKSRILYEQMVGRATRLCKPIGKEVFKIYDAVRLYEKMKDVTQMLAVSNPSVNFKQLTTDIVQITEEGQFQRFTEQLIAKLQSKKGRLTDQEKFAFLAKGNNTDELIASLRRANMAEAKALLFETADLWSYLDEVKAIPKTIYVSDHHDQLMEIQLGYGKGKKPEDYIDSFKQFINDNRNKIAALEIICSKPANLDRKALKELRLLLDTEGFTETALNTAWKEKNMVDTSADIIAYIRTLALGTDLIPPQERVKNAISKIKASRNWNKTQQRWIERFEKQLLAETILTKQDLDLKPFVDEGGFKRLNTIFDDDLENVIAQLNNSLFIA